MPVADTSAAEMRVADASAETIAAAGEPAQAVEIGEPRHAAEIDESPRLTEAATPLLVVALGEASAEASAEASTEAPATELPPGTDRLQGQSSNVGYIDQAGNSGDRNEGSNLGDDYGLGPAQPDTTAPSTSASNAAILAPKGPITDARNGQDAANTSARHRELVDATGQLLFLASRGIIEGVIDLLDRGVSPDLADYDGRTALHLAASEGKVDVVRVLLERGADVNPKDRHGNTPLADAQSYGSGEICRLLKEKGGILCEGSVSGKGEFGRDGGDGGGVVGWWGWRDGGDGGVAGWWDGGMTSLLPFPSLPLPPPPRLPYPHTTLFRPPAFLLSPLPASLIECSSARIRNAGASSFNQHDYEIDGSEIDLGTSKVIGEVRRREGRVGGGVYGGVSLRKRRGCGGGGMGGTCVRCVGGGGGDGRGAQGDWVGGGWWGVSRVKGGCEQCEVGLGRGEVRRGEGGSFGEVRLASWRGTPIAVKVLRDEYAADPAALNEFRQELRILQSLRHPNIVQFLGAVTKSRPRMIVTEYLKVNLRDVIRKKGALPAHEAMRYALDVARGMCYLHAHRPDPQSNLLRDDSGHRKVAVFSLSLASLPPIQSLLGLPSPYSSRFLVSFLLCPSPFPPFPPHEQQPLAGRLRPSQGLYSAPELLAQQEYDKSVDVYSFGVILFELLPGGTNHGGNLFPLALSSSGHSNSEGGAEEGAGGSHHSGGGSYHGGGSLRGGGLFKGGSAGERSKEASASGGATAAADGSVGAAGGAADGRGSEGEAAAEAARPADIAPPVFTRRTYPMGMKELITDCRSGDPACGSNGCSIVSVAAIGVV
ncbi:unnamed protein product [Closterium sp. NIES-65]|nr:unnamed protein product [Closterium sp. NIES-65]